MPVIETTGDIFRSGCDALVCPVNCEGVMGAGLAKVFKSEYPKFYAYYKAQCAVGLLNVPTRPVIVYYDYLGAVTLVALATKDTWRDPSKYEYVEKGIKELAKAIIYHKLESVAIPALGCGLGTLDWSKVKQIITSGLENLQVEIKLYAPIN